MAEAVKSRSDLSLGRLFHSLLFAADVAHVEAEQRQRALV